MERHIQTFFSSLLIRTQKNLLFTWKKIEINFVKENIYSKCYYLWLVSMLKLRCCFCCCWSSFSLSYSLACSLIRTLNTIFFSSSSCVWFFFIKLEREIYEILNCSNMLNIKKNCYCWKFYSKYIKIVNKYIKNEIGQRKKRNKTKKSKKWSQIKNKQSISGI